MEKVEKLLLLVVLGAAMIIMAVMSFGSDDPAGPSSTDPTVSHRQDDNSRAGIQDRISGQKGGQKAMSRAIDDLVVQDGPSLGDPLQKGAQAQGADAQTGKAREDRIVDVDPLESPLESPLERPASKLPKQPDMATSGVDTADLALEPGDEPGIWIYTVQPNESLGVITAKLTGSQKNVQELIAGFNEGMNIDLIIPGQKIQFPDYMIKGSKAWSGSGGVTQRSAKQKSVMRPATKRRVVPGMIPVAHSRAATAMSRRPGKTAGRSSGGQAVVASAVRSEDYLIRKGETLWAIAKRRVGVRKVKAYLRQVQELNPGLDLDDLRPKDRILLPAR